MQQDIDATAIVHQIAALAVKLQLLAGSGIEQFDISSVNVSNNNLITSGV